MTVQWKKDVDAALTEAKAAKMPLLLDFSAPPAERMRLKPEPRWSRRVMVGPPSSPQRERSRRPCSIEQA